MKLNSKNLKYLFFFIPSILIFFSACGNKTSILDDKLRRTIIEGDKGRIKVKVEIRAGFPVEIDKIDIKPTFKELYTYIAVVTFKRKNITEEKKRASLPQLGSLPGANIRTTRIQAKFKYLEEEDRWYFDNFI